MTTKISEPVSVNLAYDATKNTAYPKAIVWKNRLYAVRKVGLAHKFRKGRTLYHVFSVISGNTFLRLIFDTENLNWRLEEISTHLN